MQIVAAEVVDAVYKRLGNEGLTRAEIAEALGVKVSTVKTVLAKLSEEGRVAAGESRRSGKRGRPSLTFKRVEAPE